MTDIDQTNIYSYRGNSFILDFEKYLRDHGITIDEIELMGGTIALWLTVNRKPVTVPQYARWGDIARKLAEKSTDLRGADLRAANLRDADLRVADLRDADLRDVNLTGANLVGANLDYSGWPLWCGSLDVKVDKRIVAQLAYHFCRLDCDDPEYQEAREALSKLANQFHRVDECGRIEDHV